MIRGGRIEGGEKKDEGNENARWMHVAGAVLKTSISHCRGRAEPSLSFLPTPQRLGTA